MSAVTAGTETHGWHKVEVVRLMIKGSLMLSTLMCVGSLSTSTKNEEKFIDFLPSFHKKDGLKRPPMAANIGRNILFSGETIYFFWGEK